MTTSVRYLNVEKRWRCCLKCGRKMYTDRCHRICRRCRRSNHSVVEQREYGLAPRREGTARHGSGAAGN